MKIKNIFVSLLVITSMLMSNVYAAENVANIYVSPNGSDSGDGSYTAPFRTIQAAKKKVAQIKDDYSGVNVNIMAGTYNVSNVNFYENHSGTSDAKIVWKAYNNDEVILTSEQKLDNSRITNVNTDALSKIPQQARGSVRQIKLTDYEINAIGPVRYTGQRSDSHDAPAYLTQNGKMLEIAGYPNKVSFTVDYADMESDETGITYKISDKRVNRWTGVKDAYLVGNPNYEWYEDTLKIEKIEDSKIYTSELGGFDGPTKGRSAKLRIVNLVEEIDYPGEFYIDRQDGYLYFYPIESVSDSSFALVTSQKPLMTFNAAQNISFEGLIFEGTCSSGIIIKNSNNIELKNCEMRNIGKKAIEINNSTNIAIRGSHIHDIGKSAITISGGDTKTLTPNNNVIENCHIERYGRVLRRTANAVTANGVGDTISHNRIHAADHSAIMFSGNKNIIEYNDIYDVLNNANDAGAIYAGRSWVDGGTEIKYNYIHDNPYADGLSFDKSGVYLDDSFAYTKIYGNVFANMNMGVKLHGSQFNDVENNVFIKLHSSVRVSNLNGDEDTDINDDNDAINKLLAQGEEAFRSNYKEELKVARDVLPTLYSRYFEKFNPYDETTDEYDLWTKEFSGLEDFIDSNGNHLTPKGNVIQQNASYTGGFAQVRDEAISLGSDAIKTNNTGVKDNNEYATAIDINADMTAYGAVNVAETGIEGETSLTLNDFGVVYPQNQAYVESGSQVLIWEDNSGAEKYELVVSENADLSSPIVDEEVEDNFYKLDDLTEGKTYYWTVDAVTAHHLYADKTKTINEGVASFEVANDAGVVTLSGIVYRNGDGNKINAIQNGAVNVVEFELNNSYSTAITANATLESYDGNTKVGEAKITKNVNANDSIKAGVGITTAVGQDAYMILTIDSGNGTVLEYRIDNATMAGQEEEDKLAITSVKIGSGAIVKGAENVITSVVKSLADGQQNVRCIMATYNSKHMLVDSNAATHTMYKGDEQTFVTTADVLDEDGAYVKLFFWNEKMMPLVPDYDVK